VMTGVGGSLDIPFERCGLYVRTCQCQATAALFGHSSQWYFDYGLHHCGHFADRTAPPVRLVPTGLGKTADGPVGRSSLASRRTHRSSRARNCFPVGSWNRNSSLRPTLTSPRCQRHGPPTPGAVRIHTCLPTTLHFPEHFR
jgi:hypothetical protein